MATNKGARAASKTVEVGDLEVVATKKPPKLLDRVSETFQFLLRHYSKVVN